MNEIDFFLELLDIKSATKILKIFKLNSKSKNLEYMKIQLRKVLKGQTYGHKSNKGDPFEFIVLQFKNDRFKDFNESEFIQAMTEMNPDNFSEYKKFLNYLAYFNKEAVLRLNEMIENYKDNNEIFKKKLYLKSEYEIEEYIVKVEKIFSLDLYTLNGILDYLDTEEQEMFIKINEEYKNSNLLNIYKEFIKTNDEKKKDILKLSYSINNYSRDNEINKILRTEVIQNILLRKYKELKNLDLNLEKDVSETEKYKKENIKLKSDNKDLSEKIRALNKNLKSLNKIIDKNEQENKNLLKQVADIKLEKEKEVEKMEVYHKHKIKELKNKETDFVGEFIKLNELDLERNFDIAFIVVNNYKLVDKIFPEIIIIENDKFKASKAEILKMKVNKIYIQRQAMYSRGINIMEKLCRAIDVEVILLECGTEKKLIEAISCIKKGDK